MCSQKFPTSPSTTDATAEAALFRLFDIGIGRFNTKATEKQIIENIRQVVSTGVVVQRTTPITHKQ